MNRYLGIGAAFLAGVADVELASSPGMAIGYYTGLIVIPLLVMALWLTENKKGTND